MSVAGRPRAAASGRHTQAASLPHSTPAQRYPISQTAIRALSPTHRVGISSYSPAGDRWKVPDGRVLASAVSAPPYCVFVCPCIGVWRRCGVFGTVPRGRSGVSEAARCAVRLCRAVRAASSQYSQPGRPVCSLRHSRTPSAGSQPACGASARSGPGGGDYRATETARGTGWNWLLQRQSGPAGHSASGDRGFGGPF